MPPSNLKLCEPEDLLRYEPNLEQVWPRTDEDGAPKNNWNIQIQLAQEEIQAYFDSKKDTAERFELGRMGLRDQENMKTPCAWLALHFIYIACDTQGTTEQFAKKASHYWARAMDRLEALSQNIDYDIDNSGLIEDIEKNQPEPPRIIRGG